MRLIGEEGIDWLSCLWVIILLWSQDAIRAKKMLQAETCNPHPLQYMGANITRIKQWQKQVTNETGAQVHVLKPGESLTLP
jgi:hypothetical protein